MGNESSLRELINTRFADHRLVIVSNRQPYAHQFRDGRSVLQRAVSGLVTALEPIAKACNARWVAHGDGTADRMMSKFVFVQVGPSRIHIPKYKEMNDEISDLVEQINWRHSASGWEPIAFIGQPLSDNEVLALYQLADVLIVSSLHDGMNLVAKEYLAAKNDLNGVLLLSQFTGAARELRDALSINPFDRESFADSIRQALYMDRTEKESRLRRMREYLGETNVFHWASGFVTELTKLQGGAQHETAWAKVSV